MTRESTAAHLSNSVEKIYGVDRIWYGLEIAAHEVESMAAALCHPALYMKERVRDPSGILSRWNFKSLLEAMYLQMHWLMAAGNDLTRCEYCGRLISLACPHPEGRKRRRDKRFCDDACRQAHHRSDGK